MSCVAHCCNNWNCLLAVVSENVDQNNNTYIPSCTLSKLVNFSSKSILYSKSIVHFSCYIVSSHGVLAKLLEMYVELAIVALFPASLFHNFSQAFLVMPQEIQTLQLNAAKTCCVCEKHRKHLQILVRREFYKIVNSELQITFMCVAHIHNILHWTKQSSKALGRNTAKFL